MKKAIVLSIALIAVSTCICDVYANDTPQWEAETSLNIARDQFSGGEINGKIYIFGGNSITGSNLKSTEMFDPLTRKWTYRATNEHNGGQGVEELTGAVLDGKLYIFGAWGGGDPYGGFNFVEEYDPSTDTWTSMAGMPTVRAGSTAVTYNGEIYVFGGLYTYSGGPRAYLDVVEAYNPATNTWRSVTNIPAGRQMSAIVVQGNTVYLFGGYSPNTEQLLDDVLTYNFESGQWNTKGISLPTHRVFPYSSAAPVIDGKAYLIGGGEVTASKFFLSDRVDIYDFSAGTWSTGPALPQATAGHLAVRLKNYIYVIGGELQQAESEEEEDVRTGAVWRLQVSSVPEGPSSKAMPWLLLLLDE